MTLSFEGAEGFGAEATGGRGGQIIRVTNSNDSGEGSLRWAIENFSGPRIIVFEVNEVNLTKNIALTDGDVTIAGQTAGGVQVTGATIKIMDSNVIMRGMMFRPGDSAIGQDPESRDGLSIGTGGKVVSDVMIDHNSFEWAVDENVEIWKTVTDLTFSNNIVAQGLNDSIHPKGVHSKGMLITGGSGSEVASNLTISENLFAYNLERNPRIFSGHEIEFVNNYVYAPGDQYRTTDLVSGGTAYNVNILNNFYQAGIETRGTADPFIRVGTSGSGVHIDGNIELTRNGTPLSSEWYGSGKTTATSAFTGSGLSPMDASAVPSSVLANVGANPLNRDEVDQRIIDLVKNQKGGIVDSVQDAGGWGTLPKFTPPTDTDKDGMPDWFEDQYGFNKTKFDSNGDSDGDGYTNIEEYINGLIDGFNLNGTGGTGGTETPTPTPDPSRSGSLRIIDSDTDKAVAVVTSGGTLDAGLLDDASLAIEYVPNGISFRSVKLDFEDGLATKIENAKPYALFGDKWGDFGASTIGDLFPEPGDYKIKLTFYSEKNGQGSVLGTEVINFSVAGTNAPTALTDPEPPVFADPAPASAKTTLPDDGSNEPEKSGFMKSINVGGGEYVAKDGTVFEADTGIDDGWMNTRSRSGVSVEGTDDDALYIDYGYGNFSYDIAVPNEGDYQVTLFLTEPWARKSGQRVFDVELEGSAFGSLNDIDLFGTTGTKWKALTLTETVHVSDGVLDIDLAGSINYGIVSGISVLELLG